MGTSVSQRSPDTPPWEAAREAYEDPDIPLEAALRHIWRACDSDGQILTDFLSAPAIAELGNIAVRSASVAEALHDATRFIVKERASSLATDIAKRAVAQCAGQPNALARYAQSLFSEATNYLVSRDINGFITPNQRLTTVQDTVRFKSDLMLTSDAIVKQVAFPTTFDSPTWASYVRDVVTRLKRR